MACPRDILLRLSAKGSEFFRSADGKVAVLDGKVVDAELEILDEFLLAKLNDSYCMSDIISLI